MPMQTKLMLTVLVQISVQISSHYQHRHSSFLPSAPSPVRTRLAELERYILTITSSVRGFGLLSKCGCSTWRRTLCL